MKTPRTESHHGSEISDSDTDLTSAMGSSAYRKAARTFRAIAKSSQNTKSSADTSKAVGGSVFQSYTISRENSFSPDYEECDYFARHENKLKEDPDISDDSGTGRSTGLSGLGSLSSSAPKEELAREMLKQATRNSFRSSHSHTGTEPSAVTSAVPSSQSESSSAEVVSVQTVGQLRRPSLQLTTSLLQSTPLGQVPGRPSAGLGGHPGLGIIPGRSISTSSLHHNDERELEDPTTSRLHQGDLADYDETESLDSITFTRPTISQAGLTGHPQLGTVPSLTGHPQLGTVPSLTGHPQIGIVPGQDRTQDFDQLSSWSSRDDFSFEEEFNISSSERGEKIKGDSGVISGDYSDVFKNPDVDTLSDGGFADMAVYPGIRLGSEVPSDPLSVELETTLKHLNPAEVERRRKLMGRNYRLVDPKFKDYLMNRYSFLVMTLALKDLGLLVLSLVARTSLETFLMGWRLLNQNPWSPLPGRGTLTVLWPSEAGGCQTS